MTSQRVPLRLRFHCQGNGRWRHDPLCSKEEDYCSHCCLKGQFVVPLKKTDVKEPLSIKGFISYSVVIKYTKKICTGDCTALQVANPINS